jgi:YD repeat-containing protein
LANVWQYGYDANGNLIRRADANGAITQYSYDPLDRRAAIHYPANPALDVSFDYDPNGNLTQMVDPLGTLLAGYDPAQRQLELPPH